MGGNREGKAGGSDENDTGNGLHFWSPLLIEAASCAADGGALYGGRFEPTLKETFTCD
jgi:hypothetical protein